MSRAAGRRRRPAAPSGSAHKSAAASRRERIRRYFVIAMAILVLGAMAAGTVIGTIGSSSKHNPATTPTSFPFTTVIIPETTVAGTPPTSTPTSSPTG